MATNERDRLKAELEERFPGWQVWYVPLTPSRGTIWCARRIPQLEAESAEDLAALIERAER
jgi:hypothetical protein